MNEIVHEFLLAGDKFIPEMHLRQLGFTYGACGQYTINKKKKTKIQRNRRFTIYLSKCAG